MGADNRPRIRSAKGAAEVGPKFDLPFIPARYSVQKEIGRGGMGVVYLAKDTKAGRQVAIKVLSPNPSSAGEGENDATRFRREATELAALNHPNIVALLDSGEAQERQFMVMEFVGGGNLRNVMDKDDLPATLGVFMRICDGLEYIHSRGIVHRDLKPDNILMTSDGQPKITDFGLVRRIEQQTRHTQVGSILGTGSYMPPEQIMSNDVGPLADLYSLGVCLFQAATGRLPFIEEQEFKLLQHHIKTPPPVPSQLKPGLHPKLDELILKLLAKHPDQRPQSAGETARLIQEVLAHMSGGTPRTAEAAPVALVGRGTELEDLSRRLAAERAAILLSAPTGTGRSVLLGRLARDLQQRRIVWARPAPCGEGLKELWEQLGRPPEEPARLWELGREEALAGAVVRHLAREASTLLLVDDFERLDSLSQRVLIQLARRSPPPGVGWLISATPDRAASFPALQEFPLAPLAADSQHLLDKAWLGAEPGPRLTEFLHGKHPRRLWLNCVRPGISQGDLQVIPPIDQTELALDLLRRQPGPVREAAGLAACLQDPLDTSLLPEAGTLVQLGVLELTADRRRAVFTLPTLREKLRALTARPPVHLRLAELLKGDAYQAERSCHQALAGQPEGQRELLAQAERLTEGGYYREALELWAVARSVCQGPEQGVALCQAARCRAELGGAGASVEELRSLPESPLRNWALGHSLKLAGRAEEARPLLGAPDPRTLELRAELAPTPAEAADLLLQAESASRGLAGSDERLQALAARYLLDAGKPDQVPALLRSNGRADARRLLGEAFVRMRQFTEAVGAFQAALAEGSSLPPAWEATLWKGLAQAQQGAGNSIEAIKASQEAARVLKVAGDPGLGPAMLEVARLQSGCGQHYEAEKTLREIPDGSGNLLLGLTMMAQNRPAEALSYLEAAVDEKGDPVEQVQLLCALAQANVSRHREAEATEAAEKALKLAKDMPHPWPATARIACGRAALARTDWASARKHLRLAQELKPPAELATELDALLRRLPEHDEPQPDEPPRNAAVKFKTERKRDEGDDDDSRGLPKWLKGAALAVGVVLLAAVPVGFSGLEVVTTPPGALVIVSGQPVGRSPVKIWKPPGRVEVWVRLDGYGEVRRAVQVSLGEREKVDLQLEKAKKKL